MNLKNFVAEAPKSNMADGEEKQIPPRSLRKHTRERFYHFLKLVDEKSFEKTESLAREESEDEVYEPKLSPQNKGRRLHSDTKNNELSDKNKTNSKRKYRRRKKASQDDRADNFVDCDSDIHSAPSEDMYWFENEVVFIPANESEFQLEYVVK